jgi:hypothetical protein
MNIIEKLKSLPDNLIYVDPEGRIQAEHLKALAESHERLLEAAKELYGYAAWESQEIETAIEQAEKLLEDAGKVEG